MDRSELQTKLGEKEIGRADSRQSKGALKDSAEVKALGRHHGKPAHGPPIPSRNVCYNIPTKPLFFSDRVRSPPSLAPGRMRESDSAPPGTVRHTGQRK